MDKTHKEFMEEVEKAQSIPERTKDALKCRNCRNTPK